MDGIEAVRTTLPRCWIDERKCKDLIKVLENYRQEYDPKKQTYKPIPLHDKFSNFADAARYLAVYLPKLRDGLTPADIRKFKENARRGNKPQFARPFNTR